MTALDTYLHQLDNGAYDCKDIHTINSELQRVTEQLLEMNKIEDAMLSELNRQVFSVRKSFKYEHNEAEGTIRGLSWMTSWDKTLEDGTQMPFYWPDVTAFTLDDFDYFEKRYKENHNLFVKTEYGLMIYFGGVSGYAKNLIFKKGLFDELFQLSSNYLEKSNEDESYIIDFISTIELAVGITKESKLKNELEKVVDFIFHTHQNWNVTNKMTLRVLLDLSSLLSENYQITKKIDSVDFVKIIDKNLDGAREIEKAHVFGAIFLVDKCLKINQQRGGNNDNLLRYKAFLFEKLAIEAEEQNNPAAVDFAEESLRLYKQLELPVDIERLENFYSFVRGKVGLMKHSYEMPREYNEDINNQIERAVSENDENGILKLFIVTPWYRKIEEIIRLADEASNQSMLISIFPSKIVDKFGNTVEVFNTDEEKRDFNFWHTYSIYFQLSSQTMHRFFIEAYKANKLNYTSVLNYLETTWLNQEIERKYNGMTVSIFPIDTIKPGLRRIFEELDRFFKDDMYACDFVTIIDSLALKIEGLLRNISEKIGVPTFKTRQKGKNKVMMEKTLDDLLADLAHKPVHKPEQRTNFDEEDRIMIKFVLTEKAGLNLRNEVAHGLMDVHEYNFELVVILFSLIMKLSKYTFIEGNGGE